MLHAGSGELAEAVFVVVDRSGVDPLGEAVRPGVGGAEPFDPVAQVGRIVAEQDRAEMADLHVAGIAPDVGAVLVQARDESFDRSRCAEEVAAVGELGGDPQRDPFAGAADHDRDALLDRSRVERGVGDRQGLTLERFAARSEEDRQRTRRVSQTPQPFGRRAEGQAELLVFAR